MSDDMMQDPNQWLKERIKEDRKEKKRKLKEAKKEAKKSGKEKFSFKKLCKLYDPTSDFAPPGSKPSRANKLSLEYKYYVYCRDVMTIEAFVEYLEMMDIYNP